MTNLNFAKQVEHLFATVCFQILQSIRHLLLHSKYTKPNLVILDRNTSQGPYSLSHSSDRQDACPIEVLIELPSLNELIVLNVFLHLLS